MKKLVLGLLPAALLFSVVAFAQSDKKETKKEKKEIVIEKSEHGKKEKTVIVVQDGNVTINGKPAKDYKGSQHIVIDDDIVINGDEVRVPGRSRSVRTIVRNGGGNKAMLGVIAEKNEQGAAIKEVVKESAAEKAGLKEGDIITQLHSQTITNQDDLVKAVGKLKPADETDVTYLRDGKEQKVKVTLGKNENSDMSWNWNSDTNNDFDFNFDMEPPMAMVSPRAPRAPRAPRPPKAFSWNDDKDLWVYRSDRPKYGMSIEDNADGDGVKITGLEAESNALKAGLKQDDIITEVDGKGVKGTDELREALADSKDKTSIAIKVLRNGSPETFTVKVPKVIKKADL